MSTVLIADDSSFMRNSLKFLVESAGHQVLGQAKTGEEAIEMQQRLKPDLVLLDILMGEMDGITALQRIMQQDPQAKVLMVSALGHEEKQRQALGLGARGFVAKPFRPEMVLDEVRRVLGEKSAAPASG